MSDLVREYRETMHADVLRLWARDAAAELSRLSALVAELNRTIERRDRSSETSRKFWIRAAKAALAGDTRELRNRVELAESAPVEIVLSESAPAPPVSQLKDTTNADK